ncbi:MAG: FHA domain-containing protein [Verrucomicrobiales bacterium]|nr:FHA domain-containing protein [Verrucomicrobiales bacterium]
MLELTILSPDFPVAKVELPDGGGTIGRNEDNTIRLEHPTVSGRHCCLTLEGERVRVSDLGSTNGTYVDDQPVQEAELQVGQTLRLGELPMRLTSATAPVTPHSHLHLEAEPAPLTLADGRPACAAHHQVPASYQCQGCHRMCCTSCVRHVHLAGGKVRVSCPHCSSPCVLLPGAEPPATPHRRGGFFKTMRMRFGGKRADD